MPLFYDQYYFIYVLPFIVLAMYAQALIQKNYTQYSQIRNQANLTGADVARLILDKHNLQHVRIKQTNQVLGDHYDPRDKTISLSPGVYSQASVTAASIAAHEVGHAIQHDLNYWPLTIRSKMAPLVAISSNLVWLFIMIGMLITPFFFNLGILLFIAIVLFQVITLPVEFDASRRAIVELQSNIITDNEVEGSKKVLKAAALTYIAAALTSVGELLRLISIRNRNERR